MRLRIIESSVKGENKNDEGESKVFLIRISSNNRSWIILSGVQ
jgi:hypothetical protein